MTSGRSREKGSALLIVFVFAAMVAIMLYMEMPVAMFEARRQKEQLLIDRGNEYKHAVKLFVRKLGTYPPSLDALENTNQMRFLRHRFKDPFTGKDDWRLLHAGPGGIILDSKVNPITAPGQNGTTSGFGQNSGFNTGNNNSSNSSFGVSPTAGNSSFGASPNGTVNSGFGSSSGNSSSFGSSSSAPEVVVSRSFPQRPPAAAANGGGAGEGQAGVPGQDQDPTLSLEPGQGAQTFGDTSGNPQMEQPAPARAVGGTDQAGQTQQNGVQPNGMQSGRGQFASPNGGASQGFPATGGIGAVTGGMIAGVASKAAGQTIKTVNDQTDYSLWEFYYDPRKDNLGPGIAGSVPGAQPGGQVNPNAQGQGIFSTNSAGNASPSGTVNGQGNFNSTGQNQGNTGNTNPPPSNPPGVPTNPPQQ
ncbi:MAG: hypothetical protein WB992_21825 [Bryobacteraceae bacterium]